MQAQSLNRINSIDYQSPKKTTSSTVSQKLGLKHIHWTEISGWRKQDQLDNVYMKRSVKSSTANNSLDCGLVLSILRSKKKKQRKKGRGLSQSDNGSHRSQSSGIHTDTTQSQDDDDDTDGQKQNQQSPISFSRSPIFRQLKTMSIQPNKKLVSGDATPVISKISQPYQLKKNQNQRKVTIDPSAQKGDISPSTVLKKKVLQQRASRMHRSTVLLGQNTRAQIQSIVKKTVNQIQYGKPVPRHLLSQLLVQGLGQKTLLYCNVPIFYEKDFINKVAGIDSDKRVTKEQEKQKQEILYSWKLNLDIYQRESLPTQPKRMKFLTKQQIFKSIQKYYGVGERRILRPGEQAIIQKQLMSLVNKVILQPEFLLNNVATIVKTVLNEANLLTIGGYPLCVRQIVAMWKILLTKELLEIDQKQEFTPNKKKLYRTIPHAVPRGHLLVSNQNQRFAKVNFL